MCQLIKRDSRPATVRFDDRWNAERTVDLLALDDFGAQSNTAWAREKLDQLVNDRVPPDVQQPAHDGHVQGVEREVSLYHSRIASHLKAECAST